MNGPLKMYRVKQVVRHDFEVQLPDCMYRMKNIHASRNGMVEQRRQDHISSPTKKVDILDQNNQNLPEMAALELRQEQILQQLAELKKQMDSIRNNLNKSQNGPAPTTIIKPTKAQPKSLPDIIINASPTHPPYSLAAFQKLWKNYLHISVKSYVHSSLNTGLNEETKRLTEILETFIPEPGVVGKINVRLIWKDVGADTELILTNTRIRGEVNILRYLSRVSCDELNYETYPNVHEIDALLDVSHAIVQAKNKTERASLLYALHKSLGKSQWLAGRNSVSIADLAAYSAIKQVANANEVNVALGKWLQRCATC